MTRTDAEIFAETRHALDRRSSVPPQVRVHVEHGHVTLTGSVRLPAERLEAEDVVRHVAGVQGVTNNILVAHAPTPEGFDVPV